MATDEATEESAEAEVESSGSSGKLIKIGVLLAVVLGLQVVVVWFILGSNASAPATGPMESQDEIDNQLTTDDADLGAFSADVTEVPIDSFNCTNTLAIDEGVIHVSFHLSAITSESNKDDFQFKATKSAERRVKEAVERVARNAQYEDLKDPDLNTIKRQIKDEINRVLRKSYVNEVLITEFKIIEQ